MHFTFYATARARAERGNVPLAGRSLRPLGGSAKDIGPFTLHAFEGSDLIVQSIRAGKPVEYGIARKLADGVYLLVAVDESDADERRRINSATSRRHRLPRDSREAVLALRARPPQNRMRTAGWLC